MAGDFSESRRWNFATVQYLFNPIGFRNDNNNNQQQQFIIIIIIAKSNEETKEYIPSDHDQHFSP